MAGISNWGEKYSFIAGTVPIDLFIRNTEKKLLLDLKARQNNILEKRLLEISHLSYR